MLLIIIIYLSFSFQVKIVIVSNTINVKKLITEKFINPIFLFGQAIKQLN